jgi:hypothetical protein
MAQQLLGAISIMSADQAVEGLRNTVNEYIPNVYRRAT